MTDAVENIAKRMAGAIPVNAEGAAIAEALAIVVASMITESTNQDAALTAFNMLLSAYIVMNRESGAADATKQ